MATFGKRDVKRNVWGSAPAVSPRLADVSPAAISPHVIPGDRSWVIARGDVPRKPSRTLAFIELHWPKMAGVAFAGFAAWYALGEGRGDAVSIAFASVIPGVVAFLFFRFVRGLLDNLYAVRTKPFQSPVYLAGALTGFGYFVYSTFLSPMQLAGLEFGPQVAFQDGLQAADTGAVALLLLKAAAYAALGGMAFQFIARRFFRAGNATQNGG